ncbi:prephenate dehydratase [Bacillus sp. EAC]|uniref:prephenate dehydratase n=1 Tax=Bacillus sp. EAC TaxID=1978338 RepID=UPI000B4415CB|nr:prephenate dehydratase [Bacillus sp. EAC]
MKIGYLGPEATFTHVAVQSVFKEDEHIAYSSIPVCMDSVAEGEVDFAVVPIENSVEGSVTTTIDYLVHEQPLKMIGEIIIPIRQHLLMTKDQADRVNEIEIIYSHSHALAQCHPFLHNQYKYTKLEPVTSTSAAAKIVSEQPNECIAAIANEFAAKKYGLEIVASDIHSNSYNHTRFIVLQRADSHTETHFFQKNHTKATFVIMMPENRAGALHQVLSAFAWRQIDLSKIESRPMKTGLGNYFFIIDVEMGYDDVLLPGVKQELEALGFTVEVVGSYSTISL